jgi:hypothetical protein
MKAETPTKLSKAKSRPRVGKQNKPKSALVTELLSLGKKCKTNPIFFLFSSKPRFAEKTNPNQPTKIEHSEIPTVRRDKPNFLKNICVICDPDPDSYRDGSGFEFLQNKPKII